MPGKITHIDDFWLKLDNAAKIYPAIKDDELTSVFRVGAELKERIRIKPFMDAIHALEKRFPYYKVQLKAGFFWYYLEPHDLPIATEPDHDIPCRAFKKHELMFRVLAKNKTISVEFSHILTDGTGAFEFLKTILLLYFKKSGSTVDAGISHLHEEETPAEEEYEDAYKRYFKKIDAKPQKIPAAFHVPFGLKQTPRFTVLTAVIPLESILKKSKEYEISLTGYLTAVYLHSLQRIYENQTAFRKQIGRAHV